MSGISTSKRLSKSWWAWLSDWLIEHWPQITWVIGASAMTYLASIAAWLKIYGPIAYCAVGLCTYLIFMFGYALYGTARKKIASARLADERWKTGAINPLEGNFSKQRIKLSDFFSPFYEPVKNVKFQDCELLGPSNIFLTGCNLNYGSFIRCQAVIIGEGKNVIGVTAFKDCIFERCTFYEATFYMPKDHYISFKEQLGSGLEIISDGKVGDL